MEHQTTSFKDYQSVGSDALAEGKARLGQLCSRHLALVVVLLIFLVSAAQAQTGRLSGTITASTTDSPLAEVHVFIPNTTFQAFTDGDGNFLLANLPEGTWELQVRGSG
jgi:hypothetical protein